VTIVDVTHKSNPIMLSKNSYRGYGYTHQGSLTEDHDHFIFSDEMDERKFLTKTRTLVLEVKNLERPVMTGDHMGPTHAIDHNQYVHGNKIYQTNYRAGFRILEIENAAMAEFTEVGYFDIYPEDDLPDFNGAWSSYAFATSGTVIVSGIEQGLYVLKPAVNKLANAPDGMCSGSDLCDRGSPFNLLRFRDSRLKAKSYSMRNMVQGVTCVEKCFTELLVLAMKAQGWACGSCD
jgi:hypothetical protein